MTSSIRSGEDRACISLSTELPEEYRREAELEVTDVSSRIMAFWLSTSRMICSDRLKVLGVRYR